MISKMLLLLLLLLAPNQNPLGRIYLPQPYQCCTTQLFNGLVLEKQIDPSLILRTKHEETRLTSHVLSGFTLVYKAGQQRHPSTAV